MTTTTYLGGPMRGYPDFNFSAFDDAAARLRDTGHVVLSPAEHDRETGFDETKNTLDGFDFEAAFAWDLEAISRADIIVFLPGWERSTGCAAEYAHARNAMLDVYAYRDAVDDPTAPFDYRLDLVPDDYTPEVDPLDPANPEDHTIVGARNIDERPERGSVFIDCRMSAADDEPLPVTKHIIDAASATPSTADTSGGEVRVTNALTGGQKGAKPARFDLIPRIPLWTLAELYARGAEKYADHNWRKGYDWSLSFAALQRHAWLFWSGEDDDPETGCPHLASVVFHAFAMLEWAETHPELDDRYVDGTGTGWTDLEYVES